MAGDLVSVIPLDDAELMSAADPRQHGFRFDTPANSARETGMMRRLLKGEPVVICVLGSSHDLRDELREACPRCQLQVIAPERLDKMNSAGQ